ncbi:hypothetical protein C6A37_06175 [Desulfobacteraceae bacterium SEEP-SAG9]|nr:hypothetical protein C6A37_06175 [Desulfobacteraceae bacterium SEEP-SAG9]
MAVNLDKTHVFITYAHEDEIYRNRLVDHLKFMERQGEISSWYDRLIDPGTNWTDEINQNLESSDIILALVSASFFASDYCYEKELQIALERHKYGRSILIPIIIRPCDWNDSPLGKIQALPTDATPVNTWPNEDSAWTIIVQGIKKASEFLKEQKQKFRGTVPDQFTTFFSERDNLLYLDDSEVTRNIKRLEKKDPYLWEKLSKYRIVASKYVKFYERNLYDLYSLMYSRGKVIFPLIFNLLFHRLSLLMESMLSEEFEYLEYVRDLGAKPSFFGLPESSIVEDLQASLEKITYDFVKGFNELSKYTKEELIENLRVIGEKVTGEDFEEVG